MPGPGRTRRRSIATVGVAAAAFVLVSLAATSGPVPFADERSGGWWLSSAQREDDRSAPTDSAVDDQPVDESGDSLLEDVVSVVTQVVLVLLLSLFGFLLVRALAAMGTARRTSTPRASPLPAHQAPPSGADRLGEAVDDGLATLAKGPVDDVVIACWIRLEDVAADGGVARYPSETPAELTTRMLESFDVPGAAIERLLGLYRAARYSRHRLGEEDRAAAIAALGEIRTAITGVTA